MRAKDDKKLPKKNMQDYHLMAEQYRPAKIEYLLIGEAPPPSGVYFYKPMKLPRIREVEKNQSLPATIFNHYFKRLPKNDEVYLSLLGALKQRGIFLVDIIDDPIKVRSRAEGVNPDSIQKIIAGIKTLKARLEQRDIVIPENRMTFLLPRQHYVKDIRAEFPNACRRRWKDFRMNTKACICCANGN